MSIPQSQAKRLPGASELLRSLGLLIDGPLVYSAPLPSRAPGIFVVELPEPLPEVPLDERLLRNWLEQVPELRLQGSRPTPRELALQLARFWLPAEPILYVGRSARALGPRLAALYATPLGASRPHPGGHWLKTLGRLARLRIWWAETDAHEEYEDAILSEIAARQPDATRTALEGAGPLLPFANLEDSSGEQKRHGLSNSLREVVAQPAHETEVKPSRRRPAPAQPRQQRRAASPASRATKPAQPPAAEPAFLSPEGLARLEAELAELRNGVRPGVIARVKAARELGDLRENAEYESARKEQSFVEGRIQALEALIKAAVIVEAGAASGTVALGSTVVVDSESGRETFVLVGSSEADPARGRISYVSPVGRALMGRRVGDEVTARLPRGEVHYVVREVR